MIDGLGLGIRTKDDKAIPLLPNGFSFEMTDSIFSLIPTAKITMKDFTGELNEFGFLVNGLEFNPIYKIETTKISPKMVVHSYSTSPHSNPEGYSPDATLLLKHAITNNQNAISAAFDDRLSNVYRDKFAAYNLGTDINDTGNKIVWYQNMETDIQFLNRTLDNAYSMNANSSPFFAYITNDNVFHLRNANSLENGKSKKTFFLRYSENRENFFDNIFGIQKIDDGSYSHQKDKSKEVYTIDRSNGNLVTIKDVLADHPNPNQKKILVQNLGEGITSTINNLYSESDIGLQENQKGKVINSYRQSYFTEMYTITGFLSKENLTLTSGDTIELRIASLNQKDSYCKYISQKFVIISKTNLWNGPDNRTEFVMVIGRRSADIPASYGVYNELP